MGSEMCIRDRTKAFRKSQSLRIFVPDIDDTASHSESSTTDLSSNSRPTLTVFVAAANELDEGENLSSWSEDFDCEDDEMIIDPYAAECILDCFEQTL